MASMSNLLERVAVRECFYAVQGEGARAGEPTVFVRVAGCNLNCWFCDTDWQYGDKFTVPEVVALVAQVAAPHQRTGSGARGAMRQAPPQPPVARVWAARNP